MAYKVLLSLRQYRDKRFQVSSNKKIALKHLNQCLIKKSLQGLGLKVKNNQHLRKDLIQRYYIDNSDEEASFREHG